MASLDDIRRITAALPGAEERQMTGGVAWAVRNKMFAWECHPWPSIPDDMRQVIGAELVVGVKVGDADDARALREMAPQAFLRETTRWGNPKVAFRMARIDLDHLRELVTDAWMTQAPAYLRRAFDEQHP